MNAIPKAAATASALVITLVGAVLVTAPLVFARPAPVVARAACSTPSLQLTLARHAECNDVSRDAQLTALNRR
jgi:hypothetical protein